ncbi:MAG: CDGSH iron-sulfur domain-containing protein [Gammaproteobacteria bacterium]|nr:CDGSH iron-sulfur domain-containing protein [Gammaproteobacteria bacterium]
MSGTSGARLKPYLAELKAGQAYAWCACGRSRRQPFCDGSHAGSGIEPVRFTVPGDREALLCGCKRTGDAPFCDGTHNSLADRYAAADAGEIGASAHIRPTPRGGGRTGKSRLDGGCFVSTVNTAALEKHGTTRLGPVIGAADGARCLSLWYMVAEPGRSGVLSFPGSDTVLFLPAGEVQVNISGRDFRAVSECGIFVRAGEAFRINNEGTTPLIMLLTVCPRKDAPQWLESMPRAFDAAIPGRVFGVDHSRREPMADRFYQVLNGAENGSREITQFIGELPRSRAAAHRHLYEEAIMILGGAGFLWTETAHASVGPGDILFLPCKQVHSLECTSDGGMRLVGAFYPSGSPAINY